MQTLRSWSGSETHEKRHDQRKLDQDELKLEEPLSILGKSDHKVDDRACDDGGYDADRDDVEDDSGE